MDPYRVLGVEKTATQEEIQRAYRSLASKHHPDRNPGNVEEASARFKEVTAAWELVGDEEKRRHYDFYGSQIPSFNFRSRNTVDTMFDNLFSQFFGGGKATRPVRHRVRVSLSEAFSGCSKSVRAEKKQPCKACSSTGSLGWTRCQRCSGSGFIIAQNGPMRVQAACSSCSGRGSNPSQTCSDCNGRGYGVLDSRDIEFRVPPGVDDGVQIRVSDEAGDDDIYAVVTVDKDPLLSRNGRDLFGRVEVSYPTLVLGGEAKFLLFGSEIILRVPKGTPAGSRMRVMGQGMPHLQNPSARGDLFVDLVLMVPKEINKEHERLLAKLAKIEADSYISGKEKR